ncbi:MAG: siderophore-interacting protein [Kineosporiaceae bacterium]
MTDRTERNSVTATLPRARRGWEGAVLKALRAPDFTLTVLRTQPVTPRLHRLVVADGGLLAAHPPHPTQWVRLWFPGPKPHQRAYTVVDPDPVAGTFALEFAVHDGPAPAWALAARPGDTIEATVQGSAFRHPATVPGTAWVVGDLASVPAIRTLVPVLAPGRVQVVLEHAHEDELDVPLELAPGVPVTRVPRGDGTALPAAVLAALGDDAARDWFWIAAEASATRALVKALRARGVGKDRIDACGYWSA